MRLAIDTATDTASVAAGAGDRVATRAIRGARQQSAQILPLIHQVLTLAGLKLEQITEIVVADGPGSFTGLRIGWAAAKGLAHEHEIPLVAVPSLLGAAHAAAGGKRGGGPVAACFDALRGQVFGAIYAFPDDQRPPETLVAPGLFSVAELARVTPVRPAVAVGDGVVRYSDEIASWIGRAPLTLEAVPPVAGSLLALASHESARRPLGDSMSAEPVYGRPAEAQVKWEARYARPLPHSSR